MNSAKHHGHYTLARPIATSYRGSMARRRLRTYAGARTALDIAAARALGSSYVLQPKIDGAYAELHLDSSGCIERMFTSTGREYSAGVVGDLIGVRAGAPGAVLVGEFEAHTEAGIAAARTRGWANVHLFDALRIGHDLTSEPYRVRRSALHRMVVEAEMAGDDRPDIDRRGVAHGDDGRFARRIPRGWRRCPVVPQHPTSAAGDLWDRAMSGEIEGFVAVALDARVGARAAKRKVKPVDGLDCIVIAADTRTAVVRSFGRTFTVSSSSRILSPGQTVEVSHSGWYADGTPRFARLARVRGDL